MKINNKNQKNSKLFNKKFSNRENQKNNQKYINNGKFKMHNASISV